ncbi:MAG: alpha/beta hydrolase [Hyphomonadaceae bacterium]
MSDGVEREVLETKRHRTAYLAAGDPSRTVMIFVHGWPELSHSWRHQLPVFAGLGFRVIAPDMRGYGGSSVYTRHEDYALEHAVADMIELLDHLGAERAIWVGHDWGAPAVWSIAQHHPERCIGIANLCVPYQPEGFAAETCIPLVDRRVYPEEDYPAGQWDYQLFYRENFPAAQASMEANVVNTVRALFRAGGKAGVGKPAVTSAIRRAGGWFGGIGEAPPVPRDDRVLSAEEEALYVEALTRNGFFGPNSWYMNASANLAFALKAKETWRLKMPVLFLHGAYDFVCATVDTKLADPMRAHVDALTEGIVESGHWMAQERPHEVNAALSEWIMTSLPHVWPGVPLRAR